MQTSDSYSEADKTPPLPPPEEIVITHVENENNHDHIVEVATAVDAEVPVPAVQTTTAEVQATTIVQVASKPKDDAAALKIQTAFRGYLVCVAILI